MRRSHGAIAWTDRLYCDNSSVCITVFVCTARVYCLYDRLSAWIIQMCCRVCLRVCMCMQAGRQAVGVSESNICDSLNHDRTHAQKTSWLCIIWLNVLWRKPIVCNAPDRDNSAPRLGIQLKRDRLRCVGGMRLNRMRLLTHINEMNCIYTRHMIACQTLNFQVQKNQIRLKRDGKLFTL